jgi:hypothetical protein
MSEPCGAEILVRNPRAQGATHVFGMSEAKVDRIYDPLLDYSHHHELGQQVRAEEIV